jgi:hypothetical protein
MRCGAAEVAEGECCCEVGAAGRSEAAGEGVVAVEACCCAEAALQGWLWSHSQCADGGGSGSCFYLWSKSEPRPLAADSGRAYQGQQAWAAGAGEHTAKASGGGAAAALVHASRSCSGTVSGAPQPAAVFRWPCCVRQGRLHVREQNEGGRQVYAVITALHSIVPSDNAEPVTNRGRVN